MGLRPQEPHVQELHTAARLAAMLMGAGFQDQTGMGLMALCPMDGGSIIIGERY